MDILLIVIILLLIGGFSAIYYLMHKKITNLENLQAQDTSQDVMKSVVDLMKLTQEELRGTRGEIQSSLHKNKQSFETQISQTNKDINDRLDNAARVIRDVNNELGKVKEIGRGMKELQDFLRSPKLRGNIGEQVLKDLLEQYFPRDHFSMQHRFGGGQIVDAVINTDKGIIPVDSKFPMENFLKMTASETEQEKDKFLHEFGKDVKKHINDISKKYVLPHEGTMDFAMMYIPSEAVYYEIIRHNIDLHHYAYEKKVFPVSPNSFFYFLKVILIGLQGKKIEAAAQRILETLDGIKKSNEKFGASMSVMTTHVNNAKNACDRVNNEYVRLTGQIDNVHLLKDE